MTVLKNEFLSSPVMSYFFQFMILEAHLILQTKHPSIIQNLQNFNNLYFIVIQVNTTLEPRSKSITH